jgi:hypothetical protein
MVNDVLPIDMHLPTYLPTYIVTTYIPYQLTHVGMVSTQNPQ